MSAAEELQDGSAASDAPAAVDAAQELPAAPATRSVRSRVRRALVVAHSTPLTHRLLPAPVVFRALELFAGWAQRTRNPLYMEHLHHHRELLRHTPLAGQEEEVARRALVELLQCAELFWRPWLMRRGIVENIEYARAAQSSGRGVLMIWPHFGVGYSLFPTFARAGIPIYVIAAPHLYADMGDGYDGRFIRFSRDYVDEVGVDHVIKRRRGTTASGSFEPALEVLGRGDTLGMAFDVAGSTPTPFMGRRISLASGPSRLAHGTGSIVLPVVARRRGALAIARFERPIDAKDFADPNALQEAIAAVVERWALEQPEAVWDLKTQPGGPPLIKGPLLAEGG